jgi:3-hydroxyacyl-CoA dehydrogenase
MDPLKEIARNPVVMEALKGHLTSTLKDEIIHRAFRGQEVKDIAEANKVIEKAFIKLETKYAVQKKTNLNNST